MPHDQYQAMYSSRGSLFAGSPQEVIDKIMLFKEKMGITRYVGQMEMVSGYIKGEGGAVRMTDGSASKFHAGAKTNSLFNSSALTFHVSYVDSLEPLAFQWSS